MIKQIKVIDFNAGIKELRNAKLKGIANYDATNKLWNVDFNPTNTKGKNSLFRIEKSIELNELAIVNNN